jgi:ADP-ribose pyrophosphatase
VNQHDGGWKRRSSRHLFESRWYGIRQDEVSLPTGEPITYTLVDHPGYAMVVPLLADGCVIMQRVYRYPVQQVLLEFPSGGLDGQPPEHAAARELQEETGWVASRLTSLGRFCASPGMSNERFHLFLAEGLSETGRPAREATEQIEIELVPLERAYRMLLSGGIAEGPTALAIALCRHRLAAR